MSASDSANKHTASPNTDIAADPLRFPCTPQQQQWWLMEQMFPGKPLLNVAARWEIRGKVDTSVVEQAFRIIIQRHEVLRTRFIEVDGKLEQEVMDEAGFKLSVFDLTNLPVSEHDTRADTIFQQAAGELLDLSKTPLIRATAIRMTADRMALLVVVHHAVFDGQSIQLIGNELAETIAALQAKRPPNLPELPVQFGDYASWLEEYFQSTDSEVEKEYWRTTLENLPYFEIEPDYPRPEQHTTNGALIGKTLSKASSDRLDATAKALGVSVFHLQCAIIAGLLHRMSGKTDIIMGTQTVTRDDVDLENLIGVFINNLVLRFDTSGNPTLRELLARVEKTARNALVHQQLPFHKLVEMLNPPRDLSRTPLFSVSIVLLRLSIDQAKRETFELINLPPPSPGAFFDLYFQVVARPDGWRLTLEYNTDLFSSETGEAILQSWINATETAVTNPDLLLSALPSPAPRLKMGSLEGALANHPDVAGVAVIRTGDQLPYAYVEPCFDTRTPLESLPQMLMTYVRDACSGSVELRGVSVLLRLPRNSDGSVDEAALPAPRPTLPAAMPSAVTSAISPELEDKVAKIWAGVLGIDNIGPQSNFFDLGGHSLLAVRMMMRIEQTFGRRFPITTLFTAPLLRAFVTKLVAAGLEDTTRKAAAKDEVEDDSWKIVTLQDKGSGTPIIAINNMGTLYALSQRLGETRPAICIRTSEPGYPVDFSRSTFGEIAEEYVELIRRVRPHGPYILFGLCVHGVLAVEIARQLQEIGEEVSLITVVNCWEPAFSAKIHGLQRWRIRLHDVGQNFKTVLEGKRSFLAFLGTYSIVHRSGILQLAKRLGLITEIPTRTGNAEHNDFLLHLHRARDAYRPQPHNSDMLLFRDDTTPKRVGLESTLGWRDVTRAHCDLKWIPIADVRQPNDPGVAAMVEHLKRACEEADKRRTCQVELRTCGE